jgi:hypothetical protein
MFAVVTAKRLRRGDHGRLQDTDMAAVIGHIDFLRRAYPCG